MDEVQAVLDSPIRAVIHRMTNDQPIGFFDSGLGGLSVLRQAVRLLPHENFIYFGDDGNAPYGTKRESEIKLLSLSSLDYLASFGVKAIVVACNTATSVAVNAMRARYAFPIISIEPAVKPAAEAFSSGTIAILATPATLRQERLRALIDRLGVRGRVRMISCTELAGLIERGDLDAPELRSYIRDRVEQLSGEHSVNAIVLGCTHYSLVAPVIHDEAKQALSGVCQVFDGAEGTAKQLQHVLEAHDLLCDRPGQGKVTFLSSGGDESVRRLRSFFRRSQLDSMK